LEFDKEKIRPVSKRKLLLADDSVTIQKVVNLTFADEGIEVITVGDGDSAMQKFVEDKPDLVMADVNMPGLDGYRICEIIKQDDETKQIPVILLVGSFEPFDEDEARRVGADDYLTKPFQSIRQLINKVSDLLGAQVTTDFTEESAVNSFHDTLEMETFDKESTPTENLDDAATDEEIVITNQIGSLPTDEAQKFESKPTDESPVEETNLTSQEQSVAFASSAENETEDEWMAMQHSFEKETDEEDTEYTLDKEAALHEVKIYEFDGEIDFAEENITIESEENFNDRNKTSGISSTTKTAPPPDFDDFNLLELPQPEKESAPSQSGIETAETFIEQRKTNADSVRFEGLSPEMIEAIADKVVEKMSDKVIKKIVNEVVSQMAK
jgi:CheY-like chemotaxis protein